MINSCEFDQPLDLRMKALNLSLSIYRPTGMNGSSGGGSGSSSNSSSSTSLISNSNIYGLTLQASPPMNNSYPSNSHLNNLSSCGQHPAHQNYHHHHHHHHHHHNLPPSPITISGKTTICNDQSPNVGFQRSTNIHCQPLNHHQPHPLASRLHPLPPPPPPPPASHLNQHQQHHHQHQPPAQSTPPPSHHMHLSRLPTDRQQHSPPQPIHFHPFVSVKSLSVSSHHQLLSTSFPASGQITTRTPPMACQKQPRSNQSDNIGNGQHQLVELSETVNCQSGSQQGGSLMMTTNSATNNTSTSTTTTTTATAPTTTASTSTASASNQVNNNNQQKPEANPSTASPITRQHSLVSRYNCKPCGIVFSQPETLRAHQRDYCTKRDRTIQTSQIHNRSQSAVSPTAVITNTNQQNQQISADNSPC